jgi:hypothetical protein
MTTPSAPTGDHGGLRGKLADALCLCGDRRKHMAQCYRAADRALAVLAAHPEPEPAQVGEVAAVLAEHRPTGQSVDLVWCYCGKVRGVASLDYAAHLAVVLVAAGVTR